MRTTRPRSAPLEDRLAGLDRLLALGEGRLDPAVLDSARGVRTNADARLSRGEDAVVVALCGGTGVGKSSLFNAVAGTVLAPSGARRPTTAEPCALVVGQPAAADPLLDWLGVTERHHVPAGALPEGLVVLDLPDHDSVVLDHRLTVDAFVERVDVLVWVVDPLKYAARGLHESYLRRLATHAEVVVVVLNRADELADDARGGVLDDLARLLAADGLRAARTLVTSALTGEGVDELRELVAAEAARRRAARQRLVADTRQVAAAAASGLGDRAVRHPPVGAATGGLSAALAGAAGVEATAAAAGAEYRVQARRASRSILWRPVAVVLGLLARPFRALTSLRARGDRRRRTRAAEQQARGNTPLSVRHATLRLLDGVAAGLPHRWRERLEAVAGAEDGRLVAAVRHAVDAVPLRPAHRRWWRPFAWSFSAADLMALAGLAWLVALGVLAWLRLPEPPTPMVTEALSWPTALLLGGALLRLLVGLLHRLLVRAGAARHRRSVAMRLRSAVDAVVRDEVAGPLDGELAVHAELRRLVADLRS